MVFDQRLGLVSSALFIWQFFSTVLFTSTALNLTSHDHLWLCCVRTSETLLSCSCVCLQDPVVPSIVVGSPFQEGLPLAELVSSFLLLVAGVCLTVKSKAKTERTVGEIQWHDPWRRVSFVVVVFLQDYTETEHVGRHSLTLRTDCPVI